jgi:hypothetical protein
VTHEHYCSHLQMILPGAADRCAHCAGTTTVEERERAKREARTGGIGMHYELVRHRRLAHALTLFKSK